MKMGIHKTIQLKSLKLAYWIAPCRM